MESILLFVIFRSGSKNEDEMCGLKSGLDPACYC